MLFTFSYYHGVALFLLGKDMKEGQAEAGVQPLPLLLIGWNGVCFPFTVKLQDTNLKYN